MRDSVAPQLLLTARQAAQALSVSERTLWQLSKDGRIPIVRIGRSVRYQVKDLERFIETARNRQNMTLRRNALLGGREEVADARFEREVR
jgi:excisionase family DNA binding protein